LGQYSGILAPKGTKHKNQNMLCVNGTQIA